MWKPLGKNEAIHAAQSKERMKIQRERIARRRNKYALASVVDNLLTRICSLFEADSITDLPPTLISDVNHLVTKYGSKVSNEHPTPFQQQLFDTLVSHHVTNREALKIVRAASASLEWSQSDNSLCAMSTTNSGGKSFTSVHNTGNKAIRRGRRGEGGQQGGTDIWSATDEVSSSSPRKLTIEDLTGTDDGFRTEDEGFAIDIDNGESFMNSIGTASPSATSPLRKAISSQNASMPTLSLVSSERLEEEKERTKDGQRLKKDQDIEKDSQISVTSESSSTNDPSTIKKRHSLKSVKIKETDIEGNLSNYRFFNKNQLHSRSSTAGSHRSGSTPQPLLRVHAGCYRPGWRTSFMPMSRAYVDHPPAPRSACVVFNHSQIDNVDDINRLEATSQSYNLAVLLHTKISEGLQGEPLNSAYVRAYMHYKHAYESDPNNAASLHNMAFIRNKLHERGDRELDHEIEAEDLYIKCSNIAYHSMCQLKAKYADSLIQENEMRDSLEPGSVFQRDGIADGNAVDGTFTDEISTVSKASRDKALCKHGAEMMKRLVVSSQNNLGNLAASCSRYKKAKKYYRNALVLDPKDARATFNLACLYHREVANQFIEDSILSMYEEEGDDDLMNLRGRSGGSRNSSRNSSRNGSRNHFSRGKLSSRNQHLHVHHFEEESDSSEGSEEELDLDVLDTPQMMYDQSSPSVPTMIGGATELVDHETSILTSETTLRSDTGLRREATIDSVIAQYMRVLEIWPQCRLAHMQMGMLVHNLLGDNKRALFHYHQVLSLSASPDGIIGHADWPPPRFITESQEGIQAVSNAKAVTQTRALPQHHNNGDGLTLAVENTGEGSVSDESSSMNLPFPDRRSQLSATRSDEDRVARLMADSHSKIATIEYEAGNVPRAIEHFEIAFGMINAWKSLPQVITKPLLCDCLFNIAVVKQGCEDHAGAVDLYRRCLEIDPKAEDVADAHVGAAISLRAQALQVGSDLHEGDPEVVFSQLIILDTLTEEHLKLAIDPGSVEAADSGEEDAGSVMDDNLAAEMRNRAQPMKILIPEYKKQHDDVSSNESNEKEGTHIISLENTEDITKQHIRHLEHKASSQLGRGASSGGGSRIRTARDEEVTWKMVAEAELENLMRVKEDIPQILLEEVKEGPRLKTWQVKKKKGSTAK